MFSLGKPTLDKFASQLIQAMRQLSPDCNFEFDADEFRIVRSDGRGDVNLTNIYQEHCSLPRSERRGHISRLASVFAVVQDDGLPEDFDDAKPHLRPKIYNRSTFTFMELEGRLNGKNLTPDIPLYPLGGHLYSSLAYDTEHAIRSVSNEELEAWGVTYYEAMEVAIQNLDETSMMYSKIGDGFHSSMSGDNYDSARIMLLDKLRSMDVVGDHICMIPQRDAMYVAGSDDNVSLRIMFDLASQTMEEEARPLCPIPLRLRDGEWFDWEPPQDHIVRGKFEELKLQFFGQLYKQQKQLLE